MLGKLCHQLLVWKKKKKSLFLIISILEKKKYYVLSEEYEKCIPHFGKPSMHSIFHFRLLYPENIYYSKT